MISYDFFKKSDSVYFIGIGGISMSSLASYCHFIGKKVSGSDKTDGEMTKKLRTIGVTVYIGHRAEHIKDCDFVVVTSACDENNPEYVRANELGLPIIKRSEFLGLILSNYKKTIAVSGCHGKTTTTSMITKIFYDAKKFPTAFIGGETEEFSNFLYGGKNYAVAEACEYKKNFLNIKADMAVITNIDTDHLDSYKTMENLERAFTEFAKNGVSVINADDYRVKRLNLPNSVTYAIKENAMYRAVNLKEKNGRYQFTLYAYGIKKGIIKLSVTGKYNVYNALAAATVALENKIDFSVVKKSLFKFSSVKRRMEELGKIGKATVFADYAHHPSEIKALLSSVDKDTLVVFQPHTYSRTKILMDDFLCVLSAVEKLIIYKTYPAREEYDKKGDAQTLYGELNKNTYGEVYYADTIKKLKLSINRFSADKIIFVGAGDIYDVAKELLTQKK